MPMDFNIPNYLQKVLDKYPLRRLKCRAEIELRELTEDGIIHSWDCRYIRDAEGYRCGVICAWKRTSQNHVADTVKIHA